MQQVDAEASHKNNLGFQCMTQKLNHYPEMEEIDQ